MNAKNWLPLQDGAKYRDGEGRTVTIGGPTKQHPEYVWGINGFWYVRETGQRLDYDPNNGHYVDGYTGHHITGEAT